MWSTEEIFKGIVRDGSPYARKYFQVRRTRRKKILNRIFSIMTRLPSAIPKISGYQFRENRLELKIKYIEGGSPTRVSNEHMRNILAQWKKEGFVHGDLSPSNLIYDGKELWCIDWLVDLDTYRGTPRYASHEVFRGKHTHTSDEYAFCKMVGEFSKRVR